MLQPSPSRRALVCYFAGCGLLLLATIPTTWLASRSAAAPVSIFGRWQAVSVSFSGTTVTGDLPEVLIEPNRFAFVRNGKAEWTALHLDTSASPHRLNLASANGPDDLGIWRLDGAILTLCLSTHERPTDFTAPAGSYRMLLVLHRR